MGTRWTDEQRQAIEARGCGLLIAAAAGSGKTAVLVERLMRLLCDNREVPAERLLVVTFTNDAAAQMKKRLSDGMRRRLEENPADDWTARQYSMLAAASISTIDSFCFNLIRQNIQLLDITPNFGIIEPNDEILLEERAFDDVVAGFDEEELRFVLDRVCAGEPEKLHNIVFALYEFLKSIPFPQSWIDIALERLDMNESRLSKISREAEKKLKRELSDIYEKSAQMLAMLEDTALAAYISAFSAETEAFNRILEALDTEGLTAAAELLRKMRFADLKTTGKSAETDELREKARALHENEKKTVGELVNSLPESADKLEDDSAEQKKAFSVICALALSVDERTASLKRERGVLGFSDASRLAVKLLAADSSAKPTPLALELREFYREVAIDEYQDVNDIQSLIFNMLSRDESDIFAVGDIKQSIYGFRLANPDIFASSLRRAEPYREGAENYSAIRLNRNFRSSRQVVDFVNFAFVQLMSEECGDVDYSDGEALVCGTDYPDSDRSTELLLFSEGEMSEAQAIASRIKQLLSEGAPVYDNGGFRPCAPRDFCILVRSNTHQQELMRALEAVNVKAYAEDGKGFLASYEISTLIDFLTIINNPSMDVALAAVAMSPVFMASPEDMARLRLAAGKGSLFSAMTANKDALPLSLRRLFDMTMKLRAVAAGCDVEELVYRIYNMTDFVSLMQIHPDGARRSANLRLLMKYVRSYCGGIGGGLAGFLRYIARIRDAKKDFEKAGVVACSDDVVSVKTIHKSKGLEYPFVFLAYSKTKYNLSDLYRDFLIDKECGVGFRLYNTDAYERYDTHARRTICERLDRSFRSEELRTLYVALTRAKEKLFISMGSDSLAKRLEEAAAEVTLNRGILPNTVLSAQSYEQLLIYVLADCEGAQELFDALDAKALSGRYVFPCDAEISVCRAILSENEDAPHIPESVELPEPQMTAKVLEMFEKRYFSRLSQLPAKFSVTDIAKDEHPEGRLPKPKFDSGLKPLSGAEKGTAMHTYMQYCSFESAATNPSRECERLVENGYLTEQQGISVDTEHIAAFFASPLYQRICMSGKVMREQKFRIRFDEIKLEEISAELAEKYADAESILQGIADLVFEENGSLVLVDYKTDYVSSGDALVEEYAAQLRLYAAALEKIFGMPISQMVIYSFKLDREIVL